jgi:YspA, cpYpsA-related SLOG family
MRVIIAGSREIENINIDAAVTASGFRDAIDEVVSGGAVGVNRAGQDWAALAHIPVKVFPTEWARFGKSADARRNEQMVEYSDALVLIWNGKSTGIRSLRDAALRHGLKVFVQTVA